MARTTWYRLDNVGKFYSSQAGSSAQTVFRFSATLAHDVDGEILQHALEQAVYEFPSFNVCLRSGMFWHYLEQSTKPPVVTRENLPICFGLHVDVKSVLFRVSYYRARINFEVSHMVSDGRGALNFFKTLLYAYVQERYLIEPIPNEYDGSDRQKAENSFDKYYERDKAASTPTPKVYRQNGWRDPSDPTFIEYHLSTRQVRELARSYHVSLTSLIIAAFICAIREEMPRRERHKAIRMDVPVDLRQIFSSTTTKNFFGLAFVSYVPGLEDETLEQIAEQVQVQLKEATKAENLKLRMNRMIAFEKNVLLRFAPLFMKDAVLEVVDRLAARQTTLTVSNLGVINLDEHVAPFVRDVNILTSTNGLSITLCSYRDDLSIGISSVYANPDIIKNFCRFFSNQDIEGHININKTSKEVAEDRLEARLEASVKRLGARKDATDASEMKGTGTADPTGQKNKGADAADASGAEDASLADVRETSKQTIDTPSVNQSHPAEGGYL